MAHRSRRLVWVGRLVAVLIIAGMVIIMWNVGLTRASALGGAGALLVAVAALFAPYTFPLPRLRGSERPDAVIEQSGSATAVEGGKANTGVDTADATGSLRVKGSGDARADGSGSSANTGIQKQTP